MRAHRKFAICLFVGALSALGQQVSASQDESSNTWFIELSGRPVADGGTAADAQREKAAFRAEARRQGLVLNERFAFDTLFNGLSIRGTRADAQRLARIDGVKAIFPVVTMTVPQPTAENDLNLATALAQTGADIAQNELGFTGAGIRVGIIDTGVDYHHPDLGGCFGSGCRVAAGYDFVGNAFTGSEVPVPDADPDDCNGHGTHVAGIVGANGGVKGVAPGVTFGAYRVFGCAGVTSGDIMIAAMERALADGMRVINMSIGSARQWPQYPTAAAATRLVNRGVVVVASQGNDGPIGLYAGGAPALGAKVIAVASFDNTAQNLSAFSVSPDGQLIGYSNATGAPPAPVSGSFPMARTGTTASTADACIALPAGSLTGKVALIRRGTCPFYVKAVNAQAAGAAGVVLYNNVAGRFGANAAGVPPVTIPVVTISGTEGALINGRVAAGAVTMTWTSQSLSIPVVTGNLISSFSSWGVSPDLALKPDIGAPGGLIRSTVPIEQGSYAVFSGTSMSSPHVAGAVALLLQAKPNTPAQAVDVILQNSANPKPHSATVPAPASVHRQGAGMLAIDDAILATTKIEPGKLSLGESQGGPVTRTLTVENNASTAVTYDLSHTAAVATGPNTFSVELALAPATVTFSVPNVTVQPGGSASVNATVVPNAALPDRSLFGGYIVFTPQGGGRVHRVPYAGFQGDYQSIPVLTSTPNGFPWLARLSAGALFNQPAGATFTLAGADVPYIVVHLDHPSRRLKLEVFEAASGKAWHTALNEEYLPRNSGAAGIFAFSWDGTTVNGKKTNTLPDGTYVIKLTVEKALATGTDPVETWTSPPITIDRP